MEQTKKAGEAPAFSARSETRKWLLVLRDHRARATEVEAVVDTDLHGVLVIAEAAERRQRRRRHEPAVAEVVVLVLDLARPVLGEHVFETGADGVAVAMAAVEREELRDAAEDECLVVVGKGVTTLHVEQSRTPGVADAAGHRADAAAIIAVDVAVRERDIDGVATEPGVLGFGTDHPVRRELPVETTLHAAEEARVIVAAGNEAVEGVVVAEGGAEVTADIEAGPVVDGSRDRRRLLGVARTRRHIGCKCWRAECDERHSSEKKFLHFVLVSNRTIERRPVAGAHPRAR